jgi:hypothetical protein
MQHLNLCARMQKQSLNWKYATSGCQASSGKVPTKTRDDLQKTKADCFAVIPIDSQRVLGCAYRRNRRWTAMDSSFTLRSKRSKLFTAPCHRADGHTEPLC